MYGGVNINEDESAALLLPPKFAVYENIDVKQMELDARKTGVKLRWDMMSQSENEGVVDHVKMVQDTSYLWKGSFNVDFSKKRVTQLKWNRKYIIPKPARGDFEV